MDKLKEVLKEKSTWAIGVPSLVVGIMTLLDADHSQQVASTIQTAGEQYVSTGNWSGSLGILGMGLLGIFMKGR